MKKLLGMLVIMLACCGFQMQGYSVKLINKTPYKVDFFVHTTLASCCYGCEVGGKCNVTVDAMKDGLFEWPKHCKWGICRPDTCAGACWKCVNARIHLEDGTTIEKKYEVSSPLQVNKADMPRLLTPDASLAADAIFAGVAAAYGEIKSTCTDIEVTIFGNGTKEEDFKLGRYELK